MTGGAKTQTIAGAVSLGVYAVVAWIGAQALDLRFWKVLGALLLARAGFAAADGTAGVVHWRLFGRRKAVEGFMAVLRTNNMPPRQEPGHDIGDYLATVQGGQGFPESAKRTAAELQQARVLAESRGVLAGLRVEAAMQAALEKHSPA